MNELDKFVMRRSSEYVLSRQRAEELLGDNKVSSQDGSSRTICIETPEHDEVNINKLLTLVGQGFLRAQISKNPTQEEQGIQTLWNLGSSSNLARVAILCGKLSEAEAENFEEEVDKIRYNFIDPDVHNLISIAFTLGALVTKIFIQEKCRVYEKQIEMTLEEQGAVQRISFGQGLVLGLIQQGYSFPEAIASIVVNGYLIKEDIDLFTLDPEKKAAAHEAIQVLEQKLEETQAERSKMVN